MSKRRQLFRERDLARAIKVAQGCGLNIGEVRIDADGSIKVTTTPAAPVEKQDSWGLRRGRNAQVSRVQT